LELVVVAHALKMWRHYLLGRRFLLMTDRSGLRYLFDQPKLNDIQARRMALIGEFDLKSNISKENKIGCLMPLVEV
jgi:hypothetical protein